MQFKWMLYIKELHLKKESPSQDIHPNFGSQAGRADGG